MDTFLIRQAVATDAAAFLDLWNALDAETEFMLYEPGERQATLEAQTKRLERAENSENIHILVVLEPGSSKLAGFAAGYREANFRDNHKLNLVVGLRQLYTGMGIGTQLLEVLEQWASGLGIQRLELNVMTNNLPAIRLYERHGFEIEGTKRNSVQLKTGLVDEHVMGKLLVMRA